MSVEERPAWMAYGNCVDVDTEVFFPGRGESVRPAKAICAACPVKVPCLNYALEGTELLTGIWGGTTNSERRRMRRTIKAVA